MNAYKNEFDIIITTRASQCTVNADWLLYLYIRNMVKKTLFKEAMVINDLVQIEVNISYLHKKWHVIWLDNVHNAAR